MSADSQSIISDWSTVSDEEEKEEAGKKEDADDVTFNEEIFQRVDPKPLESCGSLLRLLFEELSTTKNGPASPEVDATREPESPPSSEQVLQMEDSTVMSPCTLRKNMIRKELPDDLREEIVKERISGKLISKEDAKNPEELESLLFGYHEK